MPTKKNGSATTITSDEGKENKAPPPVDEKDPMSLAISVIEKKTRNLEKRKVQNGGMDQSYYFNF